MAISSSGNSSSPIDLRSGFCSETKIYHSLRPKITLPPQTVPLSVADYVFSLFHHCSATTATTSAAAALVDATTRRRVLYSEVEVRVNNLAESLRRRIGLSRGDSAFVLSANSVHVPILYLSLLSLGVIVSPSNPIGSNSEISRQLQLSKPVIAFATADIAHKVPPLRHGTILLDSPEFDLMVTTQSAGNRRQIEVAQSDVAAILYSSGTTGQIKGVVLTHRNLISVLASIYASRPARSSPTVLFCAVPFFHVYGFVFSMRGVALSETILTMERFDFQVMMRAIAEFRATHLALAPPVVVKMVNDDGAANNYDLSSVEVIFCGGAPLANGTIYKFKTAFPNVQIAQAYGLTETSGGVARTIGPNESRVLGATGRLVAGCQAKIVDPGTGAGLPPLKKGELWVKGPSIMRGYVGDEDATATTLDSEGWLRTGDLCYIDSDGFLFYVDRIKELIKYKGYQVPPAELEDLLQSHPDIEDAAVIPYPDEEAGQVPMAFVVRRSGSKIDESQIMDFVAKQVAPYKKIRRVSFVNSIPKNAPGKILRKELVKLALSGAGSKL